MFYQKATHPDGIPNAMPFAEKLRVFFGKIGSWIGWALDVFYSNAVEPKINALNNKINLTNVAIIDRINFGLDEVRGNMNEYLDKLEDAFNLPTGVSPIVVEIRNETRFGFQWKPQASGQKISFLAYGVR